MESSDSEEFSIASDKLLRLVCTSDTHLHHEELVIPDGDIFIHCGDFGQKTKDAKDVLEFNDWMGTLPHRHKLVIAGNHEFVFNKLTKEEIQSQLLTNCTYLQDQLVVIEGTKIWGTPWNASQNMSFGTTNRQQKWDLIPKDTEILITHIPPRDIMDKAASGKPWGCTFLRKTVRHVVQPYLHLFGHVHEQTGLQEEYGITFVNCAATIWPRDGTGRNVRIPWVLDFNLSTKAVEIIQKSG